MKNVLQAIARVDQTQTEATTGMDESIKQSIESSNRAVREDVSNLKSKIDLVEENVKVDRERLEKIESDNETLRTDFRK